jgi:hypothetical protein
MVSCLWPWPDLSKPFKTFQIPWTGSMEPSKIAAGHTPQFRLMRVPVNGGLLELVFEAAGNGGDFHCAIAPASLCVILEESQNGRGATQGLLFTATSF